MLVLIEEVAMDVKVMKTDLNVDKHILGVAKHIIGMGIRRNRVNKKLWL